MSMTTSVRPMRRLLAVSVASAALIGGSALAAGPASAAAPSAAKTSVATKAAVDVQRAGTVRGCKSGSVCLYPRPSNWTHHKPAKAWWSRGVHKLHNQYGRQRIFNNQTHGWTFRVCKGSNGTRCTSKVNPRSSIYINLNTYNSIKIES